MPESISVFFPAYNDEASIAGLVGEALALLPSLTDDFEVIVVDDGSTDGTARVLEGLARADPRLRVVRHEVNRGYGAALRTGFASASATSPPMLASSLYAGKKTLMLSGINVDLKFRI